MLSLNTNSVREPYPYFTQPPEMALFPRRAELELAKEQQPLPIPFGGKPKNGCKDQIGAEYSSIKKRTPGEASLCTKR
jgi:hypothetical protein